jgi:hypothetical protein
LLKADIPRKGRPPCQLVSVQHHLSQKGGGGNGAGSIIFKNIDNIYKHKEQHNIKRAKEVEYATIKLRKQKT